MIIFTGATAGIKPFLTSAAFGPAKFAMRGLAQLMARDLQPQGIHVFLRQRGRRHRHACGPRAVPATRPQDDLLKPSAIAETCWHIAHQDRSAWSHDVDVRPFKEKW